MNKMAKMVALWSCRKLHTCFRFAVYCHFLSRSQREHKTQLHLITQPEITCNWEGWKIPVSFAEYFDTLLWSLFSRLALSIFSFPGILHNHCHSKTLRKRKEKNIMCHALRRNFMIYESNWKNNRRSGWYFRPDRVVMTFTLELKDLHAVYIWRRKSLK